jgi:UDP-N-acetylglucosamine--dolichyl-phosphate N-acetylglucosaminephosphotransferase
VALTLLPFIHVSAAIFISFILVYLATPRVILKLKKTRVVGIDVHKPNKPEIPSMGGIVLVTGYFAGILWMMVSFPGLFMELAGASSMILMISMLGMIDDIFNLGQSIKAFLPLIASLPLIMVVSADRVMLIPFIGFIKFGIFYPLMIAPIGVMITANLINILAGYNGLEAGMSLIAIASLSLSSLLLGNMKGIVILSPMIGALAAFLFFNWYPAKIFPGNSGTYAIGAVIAAGIILGDMEVIGVVCLVPYIIEFFIKAKSRFKGQCFSTLNVDGTLSPPNGKCESIIHLILKMKKLKEPELVKFFYFIEAIFGFIAIIIAYLNLYYAIILR